MNLNIPSVLERLPLKEYHPDFGERALFVWVNPTRALLDQRRELLRELQQHIQNGVEKEKAFPEDPEKAEQARQRAIDEYQAFLAEFNQRMYAWFAEIWSQGPDETHVSAEEIAAWDAQAPAFVEWLTTRTWDMLAEHRARRKKA